MSKAHKTDPLRVIRPASWIIDDAKIKKLSAILPARIRIPSDIAEILGETDEWSSEWSLKMFDIIHQYDNPPTIMRSPSPAPRIASSTHYDEPPRKRTKSVSNAALQPLPQSTLKEKTNTYTGGRVLRSSAWKDHR